MRQLALFVALLAALVWRGCIPALAGTVRGNPYKNMNLTQLATSICLQSGMNDTDDQAAALVFLQNRLEMIWNSQLWKDSLIEANFTINPDGTCNLANAVWIPSRSTLLLPPVFDNVLAVRSNGHTLGVASLESYYRQDTDWLSQNGDPTQFNVLRPAVAEFATAQDFYFSSSVQVDASVPVAFTYSTDGVTVQTGTLNAPVPTATTAMGALAGTALQIFSVSKAATQQNLSLAYDPTATSYAIGQSDAGLTIGTIVANTGDGNYYQLNGYLQSLVVTGAGDLNANGTYVWQTYNGGFYLNNNSSGYYISGQGGWTIFNSNDNSLYIDPNVSQVGLWSTVTHGVAPGPSVANLGWTPIAASSISIPAVSGGLPVCQRIRLVTNPNVSVTLRVLGKAACPVLGPYDLLPINNVEPALMAFARGDMLLRQRQNGKAQLATQEGATLLAQLVRSEAFQSAANHRIMPSGGYGGENVFWTQPDSYHPL